MNNKKKILVVEDDALQSENMKLCLFFEGFDAICAFHGREALTLCEKHSDIGLILMDGDLPGMSGFETAEMIHKIYPSMPIICISGDDIPNQYRKHFVAHHKKPLDSNKLLPAIREMVLKSEN